MPSTIPGARGRARLVDRLQLGDPEVEDLEQVRSIFAPADEQVVWLEVAVDDPDLVGGSDTAAGLRDQVRGAGDRHSTFALEERGQALADQVLHHDVRRPIVGDPEVDRRHHIVILKGAGGLRLVLEAGEDVAPLAQIAAQEFDREAPAHHRVLRFVDDPHAPLGEQPDDPVLPPHHLTDPARLGVPLHRGFSSGARMLSRSTACPSISR